MDLQTWSMIFLKHQDLFKKEIKDIIEDTGKITLKKKSDETWLLQEIADFSQEAEGIIVLNTKKNFKALLEVWSSLTEKKIKIVFANPRTNERWIIVPAHHARVADDKSFKMGLEAMFNSIGEV